MGEVDELNCLELLFSTSSPAVADWPRDASCLSVASIVGYVECKLRLRFTVAYNSNVFCSLLFVVVVN